MTTKRERLGNLTAKLHANIDAAVDQQGVEGIHG